MKTAQITYYGSGPLNLQMRRFKPGSSVKARLDDILPDERRRYGDRFLVVGPDGLIINIGDMVPDAVAKIVIGENPRILRIPGFSVRVPMGYALDVSGAEPMVVDASVMAAKQAEERNAAPVKAAPTLKLLEDDDDDDDDDTEIVVEPEPRSYRMPLTTVIEQNIVEDMGVKTAVESVAEVDIETLIPDLTDDTPKPAPVKPKPKKRASRRERKPVAQKSEADKLMELF